MDLINKLEHFKSLTMRPNKTIKIKTASEEPWLSIEAMYKSNDPIDQLVASLFNSLYTHNLPCFMFSKNIFEEIVRKDQNINKRSLNSKDYKSLVKFLMNGICKNLNPSSEFGAKKKIAGLYRVVSKEERVYFENLESRESDIIKIYCEYQKIPLIELEKI